MNQITQFRLEIDCSMYSALVTTIVEPVSG